MVLNFNVNINPNDNSCIPTAHGQIDLLLKSYLFYNLIQIIIDLFNVYKMKKYS